MADEEKVLIEVDEQEKEQVLEVEVPEEEPLKEEPPEDEAIHENELPPDKEEQGFIQKHDKKKLVDKVISQKYIINEQARTIEQFQAKSEPTKELSPLEKWLETEGDDDTTMNDVPLKVQIAERKHQEKKDVQNRKQQADQEQQETTKQAVQTRITSVMQDEDAGHLLSLADKLLSDYEMVNLRNELVGAGSAKEAVVIAKTVASEIINQRGSAKQKTAAKAFLTKPKQNTPTPSKEPQTPTAETEDGLDFGPFEEIINM